jgi:hypothetical protein
MIPHYYTHKSIKTFSWYGSFVFLKYTVQLYTRLSTSFSVRLGHHVEKIISLLQPPRRTPATYCKKTVKKTLNTAI